MKKRHQLLKITLLFTVFALGTSLLVSQNTKPTRVEATQHISNYADYTYNGSYYNSIDFTLSDGINGNLRKAISTLTLPKAWYSYKNDLPTMLKDADEDPTNSNNMVMFYTRDSVKKSEAANWNKEHVWPRSTSGGNWQYDEAGADLLHIRPTYSTPNSTRGNLKFGDNSHSESKSYSNMVYGYLGSGSYFEPLDEVKGDTARIVMYLWVAYQNKYSNAFPITNVFQSFDVLLQWHTLDKPDKLEGDRNDYVQASNQKNRNPFVDHPELAWRIFGDSASTSVKNACMTAYPSDGYIPSGSGEGGEGGETTSFSKATSIAVGDTLILASDSSSATKQFNGISGGSTKYGSAVDYNNEPDQNVCQLKVEQGYNANTFAFKYNGNYLSWSSGNSLELADSITVNSSWTVSFNGSVPTILNAADSSRKLQYNSNDPRFACYTSSQKSVELWKVVTSTNCTVTFNSLGGNTIPSQTVSEGGCLTTLPTPTKANNEQNQIRYTFEGWYKSQSFGEVNRVTTSTQIDGDITLYAKYTETHYNIVTFESNGGSAVINQNIDDNGKVKEPTAPEKPSDKQYNYAFDCWCSDSNCVTPYSFNNVVNGNLTLYARWTATAKTTAEIVGDLPTTAALSYEYEASNSVSTDTMDYSTLGFSGTSYMNWISNDNDSGAIYSGTSAAGNNSIQLRSKSSDSGIVTTTSGGLAQKVAISWNANTPAGKVLNVYGKNSAYSDPTDLYGTGTKGTLIGTIVYGTSTELVITDSYEYIGLASDSGAIYLDSIQIEWSGDFTSYSITDATIRFRGMVSQTLWEELDGNDGNITGFGVRLSNEKYLDGTKLKDATVDGTNVKEYNSAKSAPTLLHAADYDIIDEDTYSWNLRKKVSEANLTVTYVAVAYIVTRDNGTIFLNEVSASIQSLAEELMGDDAYDETSFDGSLNYLASL